MKTTIRFFPLKKNGSSTYLPILYRKTQFRYYNQKITLDFLDFVEKMKKIKLQLGHMLLSLDVISLFTNIPIDLVLKSIKIRQKFIRNNIKILLSEFLTAIEFVSTSTFFSFDKQIYKQTYGVPMGSSLSPVVADLIMQDLESSI